MSQQRPFTVTILVHGYSEKVGQPDQLVCESWARDLAQHLQEATGCHATATVEITHKGSVSCC